VLPPDINESQLNFTVEAGRGVRFGLTAIKGLGEGAINAIIQARQALGGRIPSLHAICEILDLRIANKRVFEALVKAGACDTIVDPEKHPALRAPLPVVRARLFAAIEGAFEHGSRTQRDKELGQTDLFLSLGDSPNGSGGHSSSAIQLPDVAPWTEIEQLNFEKESLGLYWSGHPIDRWADDLREYGSKTTKDLVVKREGGDAPQDEAGEDGAAVAVAAGSNGSHAGTNGSGNGASNGAGASAGSGAGAGAGVGASNARPLAEEISIGGIVSGLRPLKTRKGDRMCVFMLDDAHGSIEVVVFPEAFKQHGHLAEAGKTVCVAGRFERDDESARILASEIVPIEMVRERLAKSVAIKLSMPPHGRATFEKLLDVLAHHKGDRRVAFVIHEQERHIRVTADVSGIRVRPSESLVSEVEKICGAGSVSLRASTPTQDAPSKAEGR
jgi:DNA polymerase-3 subunit alpha